MTSTTHTQAALPVGTWRVDPVHSQVSFDVDYHVGTFHGSFAPLSATLQVDEGGSAKLTGSVPVSGVKVEDENLAAHLQAPDFFDAERAPVLSFVSTDIERAGDELSVSGDLTLKGVTAPVELRGTIAPAFPHPAGERFPIKLEGTVDRRDFGIDWNMELPNGEQALSYDVALTADLFLVKG